jgi:general stress protein YciG
MPQALDPQRAAEMGRAGGRAKKIAAVERRIRELINSAPPLTDEQRDRLALLLRGGS